MRLPYLACSGALVALAVVPGAAQTPLFSNRHVTHSGCYRIPSLVTTTTGALLAVADERVGSCHDVRDHENINLVLRISPDDGRTWSAERRIVDLPDGESASDASMVVDRTTGHVFLFYNYMNHRTAKGEYRFHVRVSENAGRDWSAPRDITDEVTPAAWQRDFKFMTSGRAFQNARGWLMHTIVRLKDGAYVFLSKDHGRTWQRASGVTKDADESIVVELPDGTWVLNARVEGAGHRRLFLSTDEGVTWTARDATVLEDPACNGSMLVVGKDLLFSNPHSSRERVSLGVKRSADAGATWSYVATVAAGGAAYSSLSPLGNGRVGVLYEGPEYRDIVFDVVRIPGHPVTPSGRRTPRRPGA